MYRNNSVKIDTVITLTLFFNAYKMASLPITPTGPTKFVGAILYTVMMYWAQTNRTATDYDSDERLYHSTNRTLVASIPEMYSRCIPAKITMSAKTKCKLSNTCFINMYNKMYWGLHDLIFLIHFHGNCVWQTLFTPVH